MAPFSEPPKSLDNSCTVVHDNKLYSYSPEGFLSLSLSEGAQWEELKMGVKVTGSTCVGTNPFDPAQAGFFVIGGVAEAGDYNGLQKYTYTTGEWTTITSAGLGTNKRLGHSATYIKANDALVVYGGTNTGNAGPSSDTWTIQASEPYGINAYSSSAPPGLKATLLQWSDADAVLVGGDAGNTKVFLFNPNAGWRDFGTSLAEPLKDVSIMRSALIHGQDGSQNLLTFDMTQSPNQVKRVVLQNAQGQPVLNSPPVRRDLTENNWPSYDAKSAPVETRSNYAMAQSPDGKMVFSGGNKERPIVIYDAENGWADEVRLLAEQKPLQESSSASVESFSATQTKTSESSTVSETSTTSEATSSLASSTISSASSSITSSVSSTGATSTLPSSTFAEASSTAAAPVAGGASEGSNGLSSGAVLGITLGSIIGFLVLLGLILVLLRRRRHRGHHTEEAPARGYGGPPPNEKTDMEAFARDLNPPDAGAFRGHRPTASQESFSSVAILMGRLGQPKAGLTRKPSNDSQKSTASLHQEFKSKISKPIPQTSETPDLPPYTDKGVAFASNVAEPRPRNGPLPTEDGMRRSSGWNKYWSGGSALQLLGFGGPPPPKRGTVASQRSSHYSEAPAPLSRRTQDSATVPPLNFEGTAGLNRVNSGSPIVSQYSGDVRLKEEMTGKIERPISRGSSGYSSGIPESVNDSWDPVETEKPWGTARAPSSAYAPSLYYNTPLAPSANTGAADRHPPSGVSTQPQLAMASKSSDMSWLNLGEQRRF